MHYNFFNFKNVNFGKNYLIQILILQRPHPADQREGWRYGRVPNVRSPPMRGGIKFLYIIIN